MSSYLCIIMKVMLFAAYSFFFNWNIADLNIMFNLGVQHIYLPYKMHACSIAQSCPTLCHSVDCSSLGSSVHEITQARILE